MSTNFFNHINHKNLLSVYITAGYPDFETNLEILKSLDKNNVDFIELGMPYSDPLADGATIQESSTQAIKNGMNMKNYFKLLKQLRKYSSIPVVYMGYLNQILQFGIENFCAKCKDNQISSLIIPDLPVDVYEKEYKYVIEQFGLSISFLITPTTSHERIRLIERLSTGFIYVVSSNAITGNKENISDTQKAYYEKIRQLQLAKPYFIGFGIHDSASFKLACQYAYGAIIGSEFIRQVKNNSYKTFLNNIK